MKISAKSRYALRLMLALALAEPGSNLSVKTVAEDQDISEKYLEQVIPVLVRTGLVRSVRGAGGGYLLTRTPEEYTVGEILRVLEGSLAPVTCAENAACCDRSSECVTQELYAQISAAVSAVVDHTTLADLVKRTHERQGS